VNDPPKASAQFAKPPRSRLVSCIVAALAVVGCAIVAVAAVGSTATPAVGSNEKPRVLTTFTVIADMVANVAGDRVEIESITKPGAEIHGYEPTPSDIVRAEAADLILDNGLGLERWFEQFIEGSDAKRVTLSDGVEPIAIAGESEYAGKPNPHAWMSPGAARIYVDNVRDALTELDPAGAATYARNAEQYKVRLGKVGEYVERELAELAPDERALVSCEGAFSYMARDFGLDEAYLWPVNAEQEGTPQQVAAVVDEVRARSVPAVFCESTVSDKAQRQVAAESGARFGGVLYVDSLSAAGGPVPTYERLLRRDAETIVAGLTGVGGG
jgi:manganese transport system substrate-binding protein